MMWEYFDLTERQSRENARPHRTSNSRFSIFRSCSGNCCRNRICRMDGQTQELGQSYVLDGFCHFDHSFGFSHGVRSRNSGRCQNLALRCADSVVWFGRALVRSGRWLHGGGFYISAWEGSHLANSHLPAGTFGGQFRKRSPFR
jgi:hypothetical protein